MINAEEEEGTVNIGAYLMPDIGLFGVVRNMAGGGTMETDKALRAAGDVKDLQSYWECQEQAELPASINLSDKRCAAFCKRFARRLQLGAAEGVPSELQFTIPFVTPKPANSTLLKFQGQVPPRLVSQQRNLNI